MSNSGLQFLQRLPNLHSLNLDETSVTDDGIEYLFEMKQLRELKVPETITPEKMRALKEANPKLDVYY